MGEKSIIISKVKMINEQIIKKAVNSAILEFCLKYQVDDIVNRE